MIPLRVDEVMSAPVETSPTDASVTAAAMWMRDAGVGSLVVVDGEAVGIVTRTDLVNALAGADERDPVELTVEDVMSRPLLTVPADASIEEAAGMLREHDVKRLAVVDDGALAGIVTTTDLIHYLSRLSMRPSESSSEATAAVARGTDETAYESDDWEFVREDDETEEGEEIGVGDVVRFRKRLTDADVRSFAEASGDTNRLHLDESFAAETRFGGRIVHGTLVAGLISAALARIPGLTIYLSQDVRFLGPVDVGDTVTAVCEVAEALGGEKYRLTTVVYDEDDERVIDGEAIVVVDELPYTVEEKLTSPDA